MLDYRMLTLIDVAKTKSLTKTAQNLCITQPAVTQHIKFLEQFYQVKLIEFQGKKMFMTEAGEIILKYALKTQSLIKESHADLDNIKSQRIKLNFGATLTISDYVMPNILLEYRKRFPDNGVNFKVDNTNVLLQKLRTGDIEFAFIEGYFDKEEFEHHLLKKDKVVCVCGPKLFDEIKFAKLEDLTKQVLIVREEGSGSRDIFEKLLANENASLNMFKQVIEIGSIKLIKELVANHQGITFIYQEAVKCELEEQRLIEIQMQELTIEREFNFVFPKSTMHKEKYMDFLSFARNTI